MGVGGGDKPVLEAVCAELSALLDALLQAMAQERGSRRWLNIAKLGAAEQALHEKQNATAIIARVFRTERVVGQFLKIAELVTGPLHVATVTLRRTLVLHDLKQRAPVRAAKRVFTCNRFFRNLGGAHVRRLEHQPATQVGVVRDRHSVTAGETFSTFEFEVAPQVGERWRVHPADGSFRHLAVTKDHVVVHVGTATDRAGPLVADEAGETALGRAVVCVFRVLPNLRPGVFRPVEAFKGVLTAEPPAPLQAEAHAAEGKLRKARCVAMCHAHGMVVARRTLGSTHQHLANKLGVIGNGGEIEGAIDANLTHTHAIIVVRLNADRFAAREGVSVCRRVARVLCTGIEGPHRVHVGVAEVRLAQWVVVLAGLAELGALERRGAIVTPDRRHVRVGH